MPRRGSRAPLASMTRATPPKNFLEQPATPKRATAASSSTFRRTRAECQFRALLVEHIAEVLRGALDWSSASMIFEVRRRSRQGPFTSAELTGHSPRPESRVHRRSIVSTRTPNIDVEIWRVVAIERQSGHDACVLGTLLVLAGPKGVGKSWVAAIAERDFGVHYVDADLLILELLEKGSSPDPEDGWLNPVRGAVLDALARYPVVSAEITGAWDSDYKLIRDVRDAGHRATCIWICAPLEETLARLQARATRKVPISETEVRSTYQQAVDRARGEHWDATIETSGAERPDEVKA